MRWTGIMSNLSMMLQQTTVSTHLWHKNYETILLKFQLWYYMYIYTKQSVIPNTQCRILGWQSDICISWLWPCKCPCPSDHHLWTLTIRLSCVLSIQQICNLHILGPFSQGLQIVLWLEFHFLSKTYSKGLPEFQECRCDLEVNLSKKIIQHQR